MRFFNRGFFGNAFIFSILMGILFSCMGQEKLSNLDSNPSEKFQQNVTHSIIDSSNYYMEKSVLWNKSGDFEQGFKYLNKAVALNPKAHLGYRGWIRLRKLRDYDKALNDFNQLDTLTPNIADAPWGEDIHFLRGECYYGKKDYKNAKKYFQLNIEEVGAELVDMYTYVYLGLCEYEMGDYEKAIQEFQNALKLYDPIPEAYFGMAKAYQKLGNTTEAKTFILKAEESIDYKREDVYNEFLNEIYLSEIINFKRGLE